MSSAAEKARDKAARLKADRPKASQSTAGPATDAPAEESTEQRSRTDRSNGTRSARKVRRTVDLGPAHHRDLSAWCDRTADELDVTRVTGQDVLSALVARLLTDDRLSRALVEDLRASQ